MTDMNKRMKAQNEGMNKAYCVKCAIQAFSRIKRKKSESG